MKEKEKLIKTQLQNMFIIVPIGFYIPSPSFEKLDRVCVTYANKQRLSYLLLNY